MNGKREGAMVELAPGLKGEARVTVAERHTAPHIGSGRIKVLATPVMVNLMEAAALKAVEGTLPEGFQTVGTALNVRHFAATPVGLEVVAEAELVKVEGRTLTFRVAAADARSPIGDGEHVRIIVDVERFDRRAQEKLG